MRSEMFLGQPWWKEAVYLLVAAGLAVWLLLQPGLIQGLAFFLRLPAVLLGVWALGSVFMQGMGLEGRSRWFRRATSPPWSHGALLSFTLLILLRAWLV